MPLNPCELEIDLFCRGLRVPPHVSLEGARGIRRTRAGLGSGLELVIPAGLVAEARDLDERAGRRVVRRSSRRTRCDGSPEAGYTIHDERTARAIPGANCRASRPGTAGRPRATCRCRASA